MKCPCKQCISFAICNSQIKQMYEPDVTHYSTARDCKSLIQYLKTKPDDKTLSAKEIATTRELFGLDVIYYG